MPVPPLWSIFFFLMMATLGFGSQVTIPLAASSGVTSDLVEALSQMPVSPFHAGLLSLSLSLDGYVCVFFLGNNFVCLHGIVVACPSFVSDTPVFVLMTRPCLRCSFVLPVARPCLKFSLFLPTTRPCFKINGLFFFLWLCLKCCVSSYAEALSQMFPSYVMRLGLRCFLLPPVMKPSLKSSVCLPMLRPCVNFSPHVARP